MKIFASLKRAQNSMAVRSKDLIAISALKLGVK